MVEIAIQLINQKKIIMQRKIKRILHSADVDMGDLLTRQPIPSGVVQQLDPFLLLHHTGPTEFEPDNRGLPFAPHPHKGFETVTFIFEGAVEHKDSRGHQSTIKTGGVQWMTAGRGIVHSENLPKEFLDNGGVVEYIQLWINLPAKFKSVPAKYQGLQKDDIREVTLPDDAGKLRVIAGAFSGANGAANSLTGIEAYELYLEPGKEVIIPVTSGREILFYVLNGKIEVDGEELVGHKGVQFDSEGDEIIIQSRDTSKILICTGDPIGEPVVSHGPFVMNTQTEIMEAMRDYQSGKMGIVI